MFKYKLEPYRPGETKFNCPNCGKKTFTHYIEVESGNKLPYGIGKCDRINKCGYHKPPRGNKLVQIIDPLEKIKKSTSFIDLKDFKQSLNQFSKTDLFKYLNTCFNKEQVLKVFKAYNIGHFWRWGFDVVFWQIDTRGKVRTGRLMGYHPKTGKRIKNTFKAVNWMHRLLGYKDYNLKQCLFGLHLLKPNKTVGIVESDKTALIASIKYPNIIWMSVGTITGLSYERIKPLKDNKIILYPDKGAAFKRWEQFYLRYKTQFKMRIDHTVELNNDLNEGDDIADLIIKGN